MTLHDEAPHLVDAFEANLPPAAATVSRRRPVAYLRENPGEAQSPLANGAATGAGATSTGGV